MEMVVEWNKGRIIFKRITQIYRVGYSNIFTPVVRCTTDRLLIQVEYFSN